jgi:two-component system sensor histidine kinase VicK
LHLAVHVLGVAVAAGLIALGWGRREDVGPTWPGLVVGGAALVASYVLAGTLALESATLSLVLRAAGYAGIAIGAAGPLRPVVAVAIIAPLPVHLAAAFAGVAAAVSASRGALRQASSVTLLGGGLVLWAAADGFGRLAPTPAAVLSVVGSVAIGSWIIVRVGSSLLPRVLAGATGLVALTAIVLSSAGGLVFASDLQQDQIDELVDLARAQSNRLALDDAEDLRALSSALAGTALAMQLDLGESSLDGRAQSMAELPGVDIAMIVGPQGISVGSWDAANLVPGPLQPVDEAAVSGHLLTQQGVNGIAGAGTMNLGNGSLIAVGVSPIAPVEEDGTRRLDRVSGALVLGRIISSTSSLAQVAEQTGTDVIVLNAGASILASTDPLLQTSEVSSELVRLLVAGLADGATAAVGGQARLVAVSPLGTSGSLVLLRDAAVGGELRDDATRTLFIASLLGLALAAALASVGARRIVEPVTRLTAAAERIARGDELVDMPPSGTDEVGRLAGAFSAMMSAVADREADLSEAADVEGTLRRRLEIVTSSLSEGLITVDEHGVVSRANPAARKLLATDDPVGRPITKVLTGTDEHGRSVVAALARSDGKVVKATVGPRDVEVAATSASLLDARGRTLGRVHVLRDITGEAAAERMKTEFLANISHELRTPLTPVRGYADVLARRELPHATVAEISGRIGDAAKRLERVIGMLVDYAALEAGRLDIQLAPTSIHDAAHAAVAELRDEDYEGRLDIAVDPQLPAAEVDPVLLRRLLVELIDNALKFSPGAVVVGATRSRGRTLAITVTDDGDGISADAMAVLTEGFRQGDGSATRRHGGLGLGLAMVQRIVDVLGGTVEFQQPESGGTRVVVHVRAVAS